MALPADEIVESWLNELMANDDMTDSEAEDHISEEEQIIHSPHESDTDQDDTGEYEPRQEEGTNAEESDSSEHVPLALLREYKSRNGTVWKKHPPPSTRSRAHNIITRLAGPKGAAKEATSALKCFELYFETKLFEILVNCTNIYIDQVKNKYQRERDAKPTNLIEMRAFIGLLIVIGVNRSGRQNFQDFWDNSYGTGIELVYTTMSINRFKFLLRSIRFDDVRDRQQRQQIDKLAAVRDIVEIITRHCLEYYTPSENLTLDEQLVAFRGRCSFVMYLPNKPAKFGIKVFMLTDAKYPYIYNFEVYVGMQPDGPFQKSNKVPDIIYRILEPLSNMSHNVTMDNWFTSYPVSQELLKKKITIVGTLKKNKPEIPPELLTTTNREEKSSLFGFQKDCTVVSYVPKKKKMVLLLSTMHNDGKIDETTGEALKPEIITFYNHTKCGVDIVDKMCQQYDVSRNSRRWPLTIFYDLLNISGINALVIHQLNNTNVKVVRRHFLHDIAFELVKPLIELRISKENMPKKIKLKGELLLGISEATSHQDIPRRNGKGRCEFCSRRRDRCTRKACTVCSKWICVDHQVMICPDCHQSQ